MSPISFRIDHRDLTGTLVALLASLEEQYPDEIVVTDYIEVACHTPRATTILNALTDRPLQPEADRSYVVSEQASDCQDPVDVEDRLVEARLLEVTTVK